MSDDTEYKKQCLIKGTADEERYMCFMRTIGYEIEKSEFTENCKKHIDFRMHKENGKEYIFDFKGEKEGHDKGENAYSWIETVNVQGKVGWFLSPHINSLVFELPDRYILLDVIEMRKDVDRIMSGTEIFSSKPIDNYEFYTRNGRLDKVFMMPISHMTRFIIETFYK